MDERRALARSLRQIADAPRRDGAIGGRYRPLHTAARARTVTLRALASRLERQGEPVTPAGMLQVHELVTSGTGPLWGASERALDEAIQTTLATLAPQSQAA